MRHMSISVVLRILKKVRGLLRRDRGCRGLLVDLVGDGRLGRVHDSCDGGCVSEFSVRAGDGCRSGVMRSSFS